MVSQFISVNTVIILQFSQTASKDTPPPTRGNDRINVTNVTLQQEQDQHYQTT